QEGQIDHIAHPARHLEIAFDMHERKAELAAHDDLGVIVAELLGVPVLDQPVEHVEIVREVDDARRIAMREADRNAARERGFRRCERLMLYAENSSLVAAARQLTAGDRRSAAS